MHVAAVGYSGVLFAYAALESYHTTTSSRSFYGCFDVPSKVYPWLLLVAIQVVLPNISLIGHLAGMIYGLFLIAGGDILIIPSADYLQQLESSAFLSCVYRLPNFIRCTGRKYSVREAILGDATGNGAWTAVWRGLLFVLGLAINAIDTLLYVIGCPSTRQIYERARRGLENSLSCCRTRGEDHSSDAENETSGPTEGTSYPRPAVGTRRDGRGGYLPVATAEINESEGRLNGDRATAVI